MFKKILTSTLLLFCLLIMNAQNTFPTSGNTGIGTSSPNAHLEINSDIDKRMLLLTKDNSNPSPTLPNASPYLKPFIELRTLSLSLGAGSGITTHLIYNYQNRLGINTKYPLGFGDFRSSGLNTAAGVFGYHMVEGSSKSRHIQMMPKLTAGSYNKIVQSNDLAIIFTDGEIVPPITSDGGGDFGDVIPHGSPGGDENPDIEVYNPPTELKTNKDNQTNLNGSIVIAPWSGKNIESGLRIDQNGCAIFSAQTNSNSIAILSKVRDENARALSIVNIDAVNGSKENFAVFGSGLVCAREIKVKLATFPDYVFASNYKLLSLDTLDRFVTENKHLPNMPTAKEVAANGCNLGEMQIKLTEKVEELTLYMIQLHKENEELKKQIEKIKN